MQKTSNPNRGVALSLVCVLALSALALATCATPVVTPAPEPTLITTPVISVSPAVAGPGTPVTVDGAGFLSSAKVTVRLDPAGGGASIALAEVAPSAAGVFKLIFIMPSTWADGSTINNGDLLITASSTDGSATASAGISFMTDGAAPANNPQPAAVATLPATQAPAAASAPTPDQPTATIEPASGRAGLEVRVRGSGFPANTPLVVRLGRPGVGAGERVYASGVTNGQGAIDLTFIMPATWPDGRPITESSLVILLASEDEAVRALADFSYSAAPQPTDTPAIPTPSPAPTLIADFGAVSTPNAIQAAIDFFYAVIRDPNGVSAAAYFSANLQAEVRAGRSVLAILNLTALFNRFEVNTLSAGENNTIMQANLTYADGSVVQRTLNLVKQGENWRIDSVQ